MIELIANPASTTTAITFASSEDSDRIVNSIMSRMPGSIQIQVLQMIFINDGFTRRVLNLLDEMNLLRECMQLKINPYDRLDWRVVRAYRISREQGLNRQYMTDNRIHVQLMKHPRQVDFLLAGQAQRCINPKNESFRILVNIPEDVLVKYQLTTEYSSLIEVPPPPHLSVDDIGVIPEELKRHFQITDYFA